MRSRALTEAEHRRRTSLLGPGPIKRLHVDQKVLRQNRKRKKQYPAITIQTSAGPLKAHEVRFGSAAVLMQATKPLSCGARVYVETRGPVDILR